MKRENLPDEHGYNIENREYNLKLLADAVKRADVKETDILSYLAYHGDDDKYHLLKTKIEVADFIWLDIDYRCFEEIGEGVGISWSVLLRYGAIVPLNSDYMPDYNYVKYKEPFVKIESKGSLTFDVLSAPECFTKIDPLEKHKITAIRKCRGGLFVMECPQCGETVAVEHELHLMPNWMFCPNEKCNY